MKTHYGFMYNDGDYESPIIGCDETACGCKGDNAIENATDDWGAVTCKNCLRLKENIVASEKADEEAICQQMGEMAEFIEKEAQQVIQPDNAQ